MAEIDSSPVLSTTLSEAIRLANKALDPADGGFLATAVSPWHALGVDAWIRSIRENHVRTRGVIMILPHSKDGFLIDSSNFVYADQDRGSTIVRVRNSASAPRFSSMWRTVQKYGSLFALVRHALFRPQHTSTPTVSIVSPRRSDLPSLLSLASGHAGFFERYRPAFVTVDEGLGTYASEDLWKRVGELDRGPSAKSNPTRGMMRAVKASVQSRLVRHIPVDSRFLFEFDEMAGRLEPVSDVVRDYRALLGHASESGPALRPTNGAPTGMVITQPWSEYKQLDAKNESEVVSSAVNTLLERGFRVVIKPHPREAEAKYEGMLQRLDRENVQVIRSSRPVEEIFSSLPPGSCVVGYNSTALLTAQVLYSIPAYSFGRHLIGRPTTGDLLCNAQRQFDQLFGHRVPDLEMLTANGKKV